jgi:hypothetical protein
VEGACTIASCAAEYADCDGDVRNGCEEELTSLEHCGGCDVPCQLDHASTSCAEGSCEVAACDTGWGDCDPASAGCETPLTTLEDCGRCGSGCSLPNASSVSCATGSCSVVLCAPGFGDCNGIATDGCEPQEIYYRDADRDGHGREALAEPRCEGNDDWVRLGDDCFDGDARVFPGQSEFFTTTYTVLDPSWDYDCDGLVTRLYPHQYLCDVGCTGNAGWVLEAVPDCGEPAQWRNRCMVGSPMCDEPSSIEKIQGCR